MGLTMANISAKVFNQTSAAYEASRVISSNNATLYGITVFNSKASDQFIQLHDAASVPADTAVPKIIIKVPAGSTLGQSWPEGRPFANGIVICNSSTGPTKTLGGADCWFDAQVGAFI